MRPQHLWSRITVTLLGLAVTALITGIGTPAATADLQSPATSTHTLVLDAKRCGGDTYQNSDGNCVPVPRQADSPPSGATAKCNDGTYSFSQHRKGTCSGHGGVANWL